MAHMRELLEMHVDEFRKATVDGKEDRRDLKASMKMLGDDIASVKNQAIGGKKVIGLLLAAATFASPVMLWLAGKLLPFALTKP